MYTCVGFYTPALSLRTGNIFYGCGYFRGEPDANKGAATCEQAFVLPGGDFSMLNDNKSVNKKDANAKLQENEM